MSETADILRRAAELVEREGAWTQGVEARDEDGNGVYYDDPSAACWCVLGALASASGMFGLRLPDATKDAMRRHLGVFDLVEWNDAPERTQAEVVAALRGAAERAEGGS